MPFFMLVFKPKLQWGNLSNELLRHVAESNLDLVLIFVLVFKPKFFLQNWHPVPLKLIDVATSNRYLKRVQNCHPCLLSALRGSWPFAKVCMIKRSGWISAINQSSWNKVKPPRTFHSGGEGGGRFVYVIRRPHITQSMNENPWTRGRNHFSPVVWKKQTTFHSLSPTHL